MSLPDAIKNILIPLTVSAIAVVGNVVYTAGIQQKLLQQNMEATENLSKAVVDLRIQLSVFGERYVTREELERKLLGVR